MMTVWIILGWFLTVLFGLLTVSMLLIKNWLQALILFLVVLLVLPPVSAFILDQYGLTIHPALRVGLIVVLLFLFSRLLLGEKITSIYKSPQVEARFKQLYDEKMRGWPVPYEDLFMDTQYGKVHVIASGPEDGHPVFLLHASGVASWSWKYNVQGLNQRYRTYAIDLIGDAGKSQFASYSHIMKNGRDQAELYAEITDKLGLEKTYVVGASEGGFIGTNIALYAPERVEKLALLGPMGYSGAVQAVIRITLTQLFPLKPLQDNTFSWAFSDDPRLKAEFSDWFYLIMSGYNSVKVAPLPFSAEERQRLEVPVLFVFGKRDNLVGDPEVARALVGDIPNHQVEVLEAGHLMGAEKPEQANRLILDFFGA